MINSFKSINWYGAYILSLREVKRFLRVYHQTIIAPAVSALIFLAVFALAIGNHNTEVNGIRFINFMGYGLIIMSIVQNSFANSSSSLIMSKVIGYISDILMPPLGGLEIVLAYVIGAIVRGIMVGILVTICLLPFIDLKLYHPFLLLFFVIFSCMLLGLLGVLAGIISDSFDQNAAITNYVIAPLSFLSGTFYSIERLPSILKAVNSFNPFFYMIDGFRFCLTNHSDSSITVGIFMLLSVNTILFLICVYLLDVGWRVKS